MSLPPMKLVDGQLVPMTTSERQRAAADAARPAPRKYIPFWLLRERAEAAGLWPALAAAIDALPADRRWKLASLREGIDPEDPDAIALVQAAGGQPGALLNPLY